LDLMTDDVKARRRYHAPKRAEQAAATRRAVLAAAAELFTSRGYIATTVGQIAQRAGVNVDTLYAAVGRKPALLREVVETAISGQDHAVPAEQRDYVRAIHAAPTAAEKINTYAAALATMAPRTAPVFLALRDAAARDPDCAALHAEITGRRAANMRLFAADLRATGGLRPDLTDDDVADVVWAMNAAEYYALLVHGRGWTPDRYGRHLADAWRRILLAPP
jgi:AcrR family transcriptional regulator